ncbi:NEK10 [Symbiodinium sp. CCMP2456]|nr:NEK10 [Symbiodinium sp. CCMP2456]
MSSNVGPPVAPGTVEIAGGPKLSRSEARRLREEEESAAVKSLAEAWRLGTKAKLVEAVDQEEEAKKNEARERSRSREKKETLDRLAKIAADKAAAAKAKKEAAEGEEPAPEEKKLSKAEEAKLLLLKEKEKARLKKQAMEEAKKEEEMRKKMAVLERDLNKGDKGKYKRY